MQQVTVENLVIDIIRKKIKNIYLKIYSSTGKIQISAPAKMKEHVLQDFISSKLAWIQSRIDKLPTICPERHYEYIAGEQHYFQGDQYILNIIHRPRGYQVALRAPYLDLHAPAHTERKQREKALLQWYRNELKISIAQLVTVWEPVIGVSIAEIGVKQMKTKWGTCNSRMRRIWLNLELAKKPLRQLEYVVVHEMVHLLERSHNSRFRSFMDQFLPDWRERKKHLSIA